MVEPQRDESAEELDEIELLRSTPIELILGNHIFHLVQLAAVHLAATPAQLPQAQLAIDVVTAMIKSGDERLGEHVDLYRNALAEVQQVYVRAALAAKA
jgi:beta-glucanase (GH16 family)